MLRKIPFIGRIPFFCLNEHYRTLSRQACVGVSQAALTSTSMHEGTTHARELDGAIHRRGQSLCDRKNDRARSRLQTTSRGISEPGYPSSCVLLPRDH